VAERSVFVRLGARVSDYIRGMRAAASATEKVKDETEHLNRAADPLLLRGYGAALAGLPAVASPALGAIAALPAAISATGAVAAVAAPAMAGLGDAMDAAKVGGVKLDQALRGLTPSARSIVGELDSLRGDLAGLGDTIQERFWSRLNGDFRTLAGSTLPALDRRLGTLSGTLGQVAHNTITFLSEAEQVAQVERILDQTNRTMFRLNGLVEDGTGLWLDLSEGGGGFLDRLVADAADLVAQLRAMFATMRQSGQLDRLMATSADAVDGLLNSLARLLGAILTVFASPGTQQATRLLVDAIEGVSMAVELLANGFDALPAPLQTVIALVGLLAATVIPATGAMLRMRASTQATLAQLAALGPVGETASKGLGKVTAVAGRIGVIGLAVGVVIGLVQWLTELAGPAEASAEDISKLAESLRKFAATGRITGPMAKELGAGFRTLTRNAREVAAATAEVDRAQANLRTVGVKTARDLADEWSKPGWSDKQQAASHAVREANERLIAANGKLAGSVKNTDAALAELVASGNANTAALLFDDLRQRLLDAGVPQERINELFGDYLGAASAAASATSPVAKGFASVEQQARLLAGGLEEAVTAGRTLIDVFNALNGAALAYAQAEIQAEEALDALSASLAANGETMDVNSEKGRANKQALLGVVEAAAAAAQAKYDETSSLQAAEAEYDRYIGRLRATLAAAGFTEAQINELIGTYAKMPASIVTRFLTPGLGAAQANARALKGTLLWLNGRKVYATIYVRENREYARVPGGTIPAGLNRYGSIHKARSGLMVTPQLPAGIYSNGPIVMFAEPETGGEALIPRHGNPARSRQLVDETASWYGGQVSWPGQPMSGQQVQVEVTVRQLIDVLGADTEFGRLIRKIVKDEGGGDVQQAFGRRR
jgi:hypothetical protein